jgi:hypothetical protein
MSSDNFKFNQDHYRSNGIYFFSTMLPSVSDPSVLVGMAPALYARLEQVKRHKKDIDTGASLSGNPEASQSQLIKLEDEEKMLLQVVDWVRDSDRGQS